MTRAQSALKNDQERWKQVKRNISPWAWRQMRQVIAYDTTKWTKQQVDVWSICVSRFRELKKAVKEFKQDPGYGRYLRVLVHRNLAHVSLNEVQQISKFYDQQRLEEVMYNILPWSWHMRRQVIAYDITGWTKQQKGVWSICVSRFRELTKAVEQFKQNPEYGRYRHVEVNRNLARMSLNKVQVVSWLYANQAAGIPAMLVPPPIVLPTPIENNGYIHQQNSNAAFINPDSLTAVKKDIPDVGVSMKPMPINNVDVDTVMKLIAALKCMKK